MFVAAQQAFLAAQQAKAAAANDAVIGGGTLVTHVNIVLDPDLSALYNTPGVDAAFQANIAALQSVRLLQATQTTLAQVLAAVIPIPPSPPAPAPSPEPSPAPSPSPASTPLQSSTPAVASVQPTIQTTSVQNS
ncbi:MAG TPA: hypothetical protein VMF30_02640 [Pirellulales bacterium]|nr:hypothetical protein [Pirellulales bacterium]